MALRESAFDLIVIAPAVVASQDVLQRIAAIGGHAELLLDRRRGERRHPTSTTPAERRRGDRRTLDIGEPLRAAGWALIPADQRPTSRDAARVRELRIRASDGLDPDDDTRLLRDVSSIKGDGTLFLSGHLASDQPVDSLLVRALLYLSAALRAPSV